MAAMPLENRQWLEQVLDCSKRLSPSGKLTLYQPPMVEVHRDEENCFRKVCVGMEAANIRNDLVQWEEVSRLKMTNEKVIVLVGATGAGKSTLINCFVNYIYGVQWEDNYRFRLITHQGEGNKQLSESQTEWVTAYSFPVLDGSPVPYPLTVVDTPGFASTNNADERITNSIKHFFFTPGCNGIEHLNAVAIVTPAANTRLTKEVKDVYDNVMSMFDKNVGQNIKLFITFYDGGQSPALKTVRDYGVRFDDYYEFNNWVYSEQYQINANNQESVVASWKRGQQSTENFFTKLYQMPNLSLMLSREVMEVRDRLELEVHNLQEKIREGVRKCEQLTNLEEELQARKDELRSNRNFQIEVVTKEVRKEKVKSGISATNCTKCKMTCHYPCLRSSNIWNSYCLAIGFFSQRCTRCPENCPSSKHKNCLYRYVIEEKKTVETSDELFNQYKVAKNAKNHVEKLLEKIRLEIETIKCDAAKHVCSINRCLKRLDEIASRPNPLMALSTIDIMIKNEMDEVRLGFKYRAKFLVEIKVKAQEMELYNSEDVDFSKGHRGNKQESGFKRSWI